MSDGYYIYLDRRDVGKGDVYFAEWLKPNDKPGESIPLFSFGEYRMIFKDKDMAYKTVKKITSMYPEVEGLLHVEPARRKNDG